MTRARHFLKGLGSSYLLLAVNAVFTFISLPVALHYLSRSEFDIWIVVGQTANYLAMIDLGTTNAGYRLLVDHKDAPASGVYGSMIKSLVFTQWIQAAFLLIVGWGGISVIAALLKIPAPLTHDFSVLWRWQVLFLAINFALRTSNLILTAHQRLDISNYAQIASQVVNFITLIATLHLGCKLYSLILAQGFSLLVMLAWMIAACLRLKLLPPPGAWGSISVEHLKSLFGFGSEVFLMTLGNLFINGSQVFLLTRCINLEAASLWAVMTKLFTLLTQLVGRAIGVAIPAFSEMLVRGEHELLWRRYRSVFELSVLASCYFGLLIGVGNSAFVDLWTKGRMHWEPINDWLLAIWFVLLTQVSCHNSMVVNTKRMQAAKFIYFLEGAAFIGLALLLTPRFGIPGMLASSIVCTAAFTLAYSTRRVAGLAGVVTSKIVFEWPGSAPRFLAITLPAGVLLAMATRHGSVGRLIGCAVPMAFIGGFIALRYCVPRDVSAELLAHLPAWSRRRAGSLLGHRA